MAVFQGTDGNDNITYLLPISPGVTSNPPGLTGPTSDGDFIHGYGGIDNLDGGLGNDTLSGGDGNDFLFDGLGGDDRLFGEAGIDRIQGGVGDDVIDGGTWGDALTGDLGDDEIRGKTGNDSIFGDNFQPGAAGRDTIFAGSGDDLVWGNGGADFINGGTGADTMIGGAGADTLVGGAGDDHFVFDLTLTDSIPAAFDVIRGDNGAGGTGGPAFDGAGVAGGDLIDLTLVSTYGEPPHEEPFIFGGRGVGHVWLAENGARTLVYANVEGDNTPEFKLAIDDGAVRATDYTADDFIL